MKCGNVIYLVDNFGPFIGIITHIHSEDVVTIQACAPTAVTATGSAFEDETFSIIVNLCDRNIKEHHIYETIRDAMEEHFDLFI